MAKKKKDYFKFFLILAIIIIIAYSSYSTIKIRKLEEQIETINTIKELRVEQINGELSQFEVITKRFADNHNFDIENYNCINYSNDLMSILNDLGYNTEYEVGCPEEPYNSEILGRNENITCHRYLKVIFEFEPQTAEFVDYSIEYPDKLT